MAAFRILELPEAIKLNACDASFGVVLLAGVHVLPAHKGVSVPLRYEFAKL